MHKVHPGTYFQLSINKIFIHFIIPKWIALVVHCYVLFGYVLSKIVMYYPK